MNNHIGRPINNKIKVSKRMIIILIPIVLIVVVLIIVGMSGSTGLMGNSVYEENNCMYTCEEGWTLDEKSHTCYQENTSESRLIGDVINESGEYIPDGKVTLQDIGVIQNAITNNEDLGEIQYLIYDLNHDGLVDQQDIEGYSTSTAGEVVFNNEKECPDNKEHQNDENGIKTIKKIIYSKNDDFCNVSVTTRREKNSICNKKELQTNDNNEKKDKDNSILSAQEGYSIKPEQVPDSNRLYAETNKLSFTYRVYKDGKIYNQPVLYMVRTFDSLENSNDNGTFSYISRSCKLMTSGKISFDLNMETTPYKYFIIDVYEYNGKYECNDENLILQKKSDVYKTKINSITKVDKKIKTHKLSQNKVAVTVEEPNDEKVKQAGRYTIKYTYKINDSQTPYRYVVYRWVWHPSGNTKVKSSKSYKNDCVKVVDGMTQTFTFATKKGYTTNARLDVYPSDRCGTNGLFDGSILSPYYKIDN